MLCTLRTLDRTPSGLYRTLLAPPCARSSRLSMTCYRLCIDLVSPGRRHQVHMSEYRSDYTYPWAGIYFAFIHTRPGKGRKGFAAPYRPGLQAVQMGRAAGPAAGSRAATAPRRARRRRRTAAATRRAQR